MLIFGPLGGRFCILGHYSGPGPLRIKIFVLGGSSHIIGLGRVHILNLRFFLENESLLAQKRGVLILGYLSLSQNWRHYKKKFEI